MPANCQSRMTRPLESCTERNRSSDGSQAKLWETGPAGTSNRTMLSGLV